MYALISHSNASYKRLADLTWTANKALYAERHGYIAFNKENNFVTGTDIMTGFEKIHMAKEILSNISEIDWLWFTGTDSIITNFDIRIEDKIDNNYHLIIAVDVNGVNADSLLVRNTTEGIGFLQNVIDTESHFNNFWDSEQRAISHLLGWPGTGEAGWPYGSDLIVSNKYKDIVKIVPQRYMNSFDYSLYHYRDQRDKTGADGNWRPGDWLLHWPAISLENRIKLYENVKDKIIK